MASLKTAPLQDDNAYENACGWGKISPFDILRVKIPLSLGGRDVALTGRLTEIELFLGTKGKLDGRARLNHPHHEVALIP